jgi:hypothetical protein
MDSGKWVDMVAEQIGARMASIAHFKSFSNHQLLKGLYAEACVRDLIKSFVFPLRVSRGTILHEGNAGGNSAQEIDAIIWQASPLPALFEAGDFAVVPRGSAVGYLEVKRGNYNGEVGLGIQGVLKVDSTLVPDYDGPVAQALSQLHRSLGVICLYEPSGPKDAVLDNLISEGRVVKVLIDPASGGVPTVDVQGFISLANFLNGVRQRAAMVAGATRLMRPGPPAPTSSPSSKPISTNPLHDQP